MSFLYCGVPTKLQVDDLIAVGIDHGTKQQVLEFYRGGVKLQQGGRSRGAEYSILATSLDLRDGIEPALIFLKSLFEALDIQTRENQRVNVPFARFVLQITSVGS